jgi:hypothetical protein
LKTVLEDYWKDANRIENRVGKPPVPNPLMDPPIPGNLVLPEDVVEAVTLTMEALLQRVRFLGPVRHRFSSIARVAASAPTDVGNIGEHTADLLGRSAETLEQVNAWLARLGVGYSLQVEHPSDEGLAGYWKIVLHDAVLDTAVSMDQLGYGISQLIPIIADAVAEPAHILALEQPELHLHPRLQAELGSLFADGIRRGNQFLVETHSEHLLLRLQRLIRTGRLTPDDVSVIYVLKTPEGSQCLHLRLDTQGDFLDPWPDGFFEESYRELFGGEVE